MKLRWILGKHSVMTFEVNHEEKTAQPILENGQSHPKGPLARLIFPENKQTYVGLEAELNYLLRTNYRTGNRSLEELLQEISSGTAFSAKEPYLTLDIPKVSGHLTLKETHILNGTLVLEHHEIFGDNLLKGNQHKDVFLHEGKAVMVKRDNVNPEFGDDWEPGNYDYSYSSVAETLVSILIDNLSGLNTDSHARYQFLMIDDGKTVQSGTLSPLLTKETEVDWVLSDPRQRERKVLIDLETFAAKIVDSPPLERFHYLVQLYSSFDGIDEPQARAFLRDQIALDILTLNQDRHTNAGNYAVVFDEVTGHARLINYDYGRSLPTPVPWSDRTEEAYVDDYLTEDMEDDIRNNSRLKNRHHSLLVGLDFETILAFLQEEGFQPFRLNCPQFEQDCQDFLQQLEDLQVPFIKFARYKVAMLQTILDTDWGRALVVSKYENNFIRS